MKSYICLAVSVLMTASIGALAMEQAKLNPYKDFLSTVKPLDLPLQCASSVAKAAKSEQEKTTVLVIDAVVETHPPLTAVVVGTIAKAVPEMSAIAAARGCALQPSLAGLIVRAAASAAPTEAGRIVYSVCRSMPHLFKEVAAAASSASPAIGSEILGALTLAVPELKPFILEAAAQARGEDATVAKVVNKAAVAAGTSRLSSLAESATVASAMPVMPPPRIGLPFVPLTGTPGEINPDNSGDVPVGGRDYAAP